MNGSKNQMISQDTQNYVVHAYVTAKYINHNAQLSGPFERRAYGLRCLGSSRKPRVGLGQYVPILQEILNSDLPKP